MAKKFQRGTGKKNQKDGKGTVQIAVTLYDPETLRPHTKGNIMRTLRVADTKVSEVAKALEQSLFG